MKNLKVQGNTVKVKSIRITAKCSDNCYSELLDDKGNVVADHSGYVPEFMPGENTFGDYVELEIDLESGQVLNWNKKNLKYLPRTEWALSTN